MRTTTRTADDRERGAPSGTAAGLYIHVPFCRERCPFCSFAITTVREDRGAWLEALEREMERRAPEWADLGFDTLYLGGGTPSLLPPDWVARILVMARARFRLADGAEVTIEANPGTCRSEDYAALRRAGVNRLSLGVQSLDDDDLRLLGRDHDARDAADAFRWARQAGFENISIDLIWGLPGRDADRWVAALAAAAALGAEHVSAYQLSFEPGTAMTRRLEAGELRAPSADEAAGLFLRTRDELARRGYAQYEVSSFARSPDFESRHNRKYWEEAPYLGLGPSAHSFRAPRRFWNAAGTRDYIRRLLAGELATAGEETLSADQRRLERLMLRLRTVRGLDLGAFAADFGVRLEDRHAATLDALAREGLAVIEPALLRLTPAGLARADGIAARLAL